MTFSKIKLFGLLALSYSLIACGQAPVSTAPNTTPNAIGQTTTAPQPTANPAVVAKSSELQSSAKSKTAQSPWIESEKAPDPTLEMAILKDDPISSSSSTRVNTYRYAKVDLNGDASPEVVVHLTGSSFCGTGGCTTLIFQQLRGQYQLMGRISTSHAPIIVSGNTSNGWNDLIVYTRDAVPMLVKFGEKDYGEKVDLAPSADLSGTYLFAKKYREYQGSEFPLTASGSQSRTAPTNSEASSSSNGIMPSKNSDAQIVRGRCIVGIVGLEEGSRVNMRSAPGAESDTVGYVLVGQRVAQLYDGIAGDASIVRKSDGERVSWDYVEYLPSQTRGWIASSLLDQSCSSRQSR
jgi:hypothetical protein